MLKGHLQYCTRKTYYKWCYFLIKGQCHKILNRWHELLARTGYESWVFTNFPVSTYNYSTVHVVPEVNSAEVSYPLLTKKNV